LSTVKTQNEILNDISTKLDIIVAFLAARGIEGDPAIIVEKLHKINIDYKVIALVAGISENAVSIRLTRLKKKPKIKKTFKLNDDNRIS
jgi:hypothetical protein